MTLSPRLTDSLARSLLAPPVAPGERPVSFYACGITPYAPAHIGHARSFVVFDAMAQMLRRAGYEVDLVRNITDIDDKILAAAKAQGEDWHAFAHRHAAANRELLAQVGVEGFEEPSASEHVPAIVDLVERLVAKGHAYVNPESGDVLFEVGSFEGSALMPHQAEALLEHGAHRVNHTGKRSPLDFVLWKSAKPGEPYWPSPWGNGRPGWHIECSAMIEARFGTTVDYHGGGTDLRFPHHQAEIQQSEAAYGRPLAHRWVHHGSVRDAHGKKMSKSLGNYVTLEDGLRDAEGLLPGAGGSVLRLALLSALWTKPLDWSPALLAQAASHLSAWAQAAGNALPDESAAAPVLEALADNLNTPEAFRALHGLARQASQGDELAAGGVAAALEALGVPAARYHPLLKQAEISSEVLALVNAREQFRQARDWANADVARQQLEALGFSVKDGPQGPAVTRKPRP